MATPLSPTALGVRDDTRCRGARRGERLMAGQRLAQRLYKNSSASGIEEQFSRALFFPSSRAQGEGPRQQGGITESSSNIHRPMVGLTEWMPSRLRSGILDPFGFTSAWVELQRDKQGWLLLAMTGYKVITQYAGARKTKRGTGYSHHRDAGGYKPQWRYFWRMVDVADGSRQRHSCFENSESARRYGRNGRLVISATGRSRRHSRVLCMGGKNRAHINDHSGGSLGRTLPRTRHASPGDARRFRLRNG